MNGYRTHAPSFDRKAGDTLRRVLVRDQGDRDTISLTGSASVRVAGEWLGPSAGPALG
jgi:hypothetical protein